MKSIHEIVRKAQTNYISGTVTLGKYVNWSMYDTIETIDAYLASKHTSGPVDSLGREKPFFNITTAAANIWMRATDIARKDIHILPDSSADLAMAFVATVLLQEWMNKARFGVFLKEWGRALARYGSAVVKFVEQNGELKATVVPWNRFIADPIDFDSIPRIEKFYKTPEQLRAMKAYDQEQVSLLIEAQQQTRRTASGLNKDNQTGFIELYEVHGRLPTYLLKDDPAQVDDEKIQYSQQMHVVSFVQKDRDNWQDFTLYKGKEAKDPYMLTHLLREDGRTLSIGSVEYLFDAQWMANHTMKQWRDQLDITSKVIFQTQDTSFVGRNVLSALETGDILIHGLNMPLQAVPNGGHDITALQAFYDEWNTMAEGLTSTPAPMRGQALPGTTAYRQAAMLMQAANDFFAILTQNKGLYLEDMMRAYVIPYFKKQLGNKDEVAAILDDQAVTEIDEMYIPREAIRRHNEQVKKSLLVGKLPQAFDPVSGQAAVRADLQPLGNKRFIKPDDLDEKTWKQALDGLEMRVVVEVSNEAHDQQTVLQVLTQTLQTIATNPLILQDPNAKMLFSRILEESGVISPLQLQSTPTPSAPPQMQPQQPQQPQGAQPTPMAAPPGLPITPQPNGQA